MIEYIKKTLLLLLILSYFSCDEKTKIEEKIFCTDTTISKHTVRVSFCTKGNVLSLKLANNTNDKLYFFNSRFIYHRTFFYKIKNNTKIDISEGMMKFGFGRGLYYSDTIFKRMTSKDYLTESEINRLCENISNNIRVHYHFNMDSLFRDSIQYMFYLKGVLGNTILLNPGEVYYDKFWIETDSVDFDTLYLVFDNIDRSKYVAKFKVNFDTVKYFYPNEINGFKRYDGIIESDTLVYANPNFKRGFIDFLKNKIGFGEK